MPDQPKILDVFEKNLRPMQYWHVRAEDRLTQWASGKPEGYSTGFRAINDLSRLIPTELMIIAARPSQGKTAIAMQMCQSVANQIQAVGDNGCVAIFSAEMAGWSLYLRMASAVCGVNVHDVRNGKGTSDGIRRLKDAMQTIRELPIWMDDNTGPTTKQMLEQLSELNETMPVRLMMFDFMELGGDRNEHEEQRISQIAHNLKGIAKTLEIPVVALSQLNRRVEDRGNKMPVLSDLRH